MKESLHLFFSLVAYIILAISAIYGLKELSNDYQFTNMLICIYAILYSPIGLMLECFPERNCFEECRYENTYKNKCFFRSFHLPIGGLILGTSKLGMFMSIYLIIFGTISLIYYCRTKKENNLNEPDIDQNSNILSPISDEAIDPFSDRFSEL